MVSASLELLYSFQELSDISNICLVAMATWVLSRGYLLFSIQGVGAAPWRAAGVSEIVRGAALQISATSPPHCSHLQPLQSPPAPPVTSTLQPLTTWRTRHQWPHRPPPDSLGRLCVNAKLGAPGRRHGRETRAEVPRVMWPYDDMTIWMAIWRHLEA